MKSLRTPALVLALALCHLPLAGTIDVRFQVRVPPLKAGEQLLVMGDFNQWKGDDYRLSNIPGSQVYQAVFPLELAPGDSLSYKFVVKRPKGSLYWEKNPNPTNPPYGNRLLIAGEGGAMELPVAEFQTDAYFRFPVILGRRDMEADFGQMRDLLEEVHPALYDYHSREYMDSVFARCASQIKDSMLFREYLCLLSEVVSQVGCGHSSMWIPGDYWNVAPEGLFPLKLKLSDGGVFVRGSYAAQGVEMVGVGSRILGINGMPVETIVGELERLTSADGMNPAYKRAMVEKNFALKFALRYGFSERFQISCVPFGSSGALELELTPVSKAQVDASRDQKNELSLKELEQGVALLTVNTFAYYGRVDEFRAFLDSSFQVIREKKLDRLLLDLRGNSGGDPFCAAVLLSFLESEAVPYFEAPYGRYDTLARPIPVAPWHYEGQLLTLIDGRGFSTSGHFCALLKYHGIGSFVGSELGATYTCTGNAMYPALDRTRIMLGTARVQRYTVAVEGMDPRRGVLPDYPCAASPDDLAMGRDGVLEFAVQLITEGATAPGD